MKTILLAGGFGTRLGEVTEIKPKPMVEIGGRPILWHIMGVYAAHGYKEFVVALGYKGEVIKRYFLNHYYFTHDFSIRLDNGEVDVRDGEDEDWKVHLVETGLHTKTGGRIKRLSSWVDGETFMMTYGDGVSDVDVRALVDFHEDHGRLATVTAVRPPSRFGGLTFDGDRVEDFVEKPQIGQGWINGGFFVLEPEVLDYIDGDDTSFEREPLERLADDGQLMAYRHDDFWQCMDTMRDVRLLRKMYEDGERPWRGASP